MTEFTQTVARILTPLEVAELLQIPVRTLEEWRLRKYGPPYRKLGRHVRYEINAVMAWFDNE
jgi:excisionase family DNA binding protein